MIKVKLVDNYPELEIDLGMSITLRKGDTIDAHESYELDYAMQMGFVEEVKTCEAKEIKEEKKTDGSEIWVFAEQRHGKISRVVLELLGKARELADDRCTNVGAVLLCEKNEHMSKELIEHGADKVYLAEDILLKDYRTDAYTKVIAAAIKKYIPDIMIYGATNIGRDLAPRVAQRITTGLTADCTGLDIDEDGLLLQTRPAFGGNLMAQIKCPNHKPQMSTVRPGVMKSLARDEKRKGDVVKIDATLSEEDILTKIIKIVKEQKKKANLEEAEIIISVGRGLGKKENFKMIEELAKLMRAEIGASRAVVDSGWIGQEHQVGQTGKTVRPKLYLAFGISGSIQHIAGMQNSEMIVAVNKDPNAPIFQIAHYGIVADLNIVIPEMIGLLKGD